MFFLYSLSLHSPQFKTYLKSVNGQRLQITADFLLKKLLTLLSSKALESLTLGIKVMFFPKVFCVERGKKEV